MKKKEILKYLLALQICVMTLSGETTDISAKEMFNKLQMQENAVIKENRIQAAVTDKVRIVGDDEDVSSVYPFHLYGVFDISVPEISKYCVMNTGNFGYGGWEDVTREKEASHLTDEGGVVN